MDVIRCAPILTTDPSDRLEFRGPFRSKPVKTALRLSNNSGRHRLAFKIKSTAPRGKLIVRPNFGVIEPKQTVDVDVTLVPHDIYALAKPYRFMVQSTIIARQAVDLDTIWKTIPVRMISETKLNCVFYNSEGAVINHDANNNINKNSALALITAPSSDSQKKLRNHQEVAEYFKEFVELDKLARETAQPDKIFDGVLVTLPHFYAAVAILFIGYIFGRWIA